MRQGLLCMLCLVGLLPTWAQPADSLQHLVNALPESEQTSAWLQHSEYYLNRNPEVSQQLGEKALSLAIRLDQDSLQAYAHNRLCTAYGMQSAFQPALENILKAIDIWETRGDSLGLGIGYNNLGLIYQYQNQWAKALQYHLLALAIKQATGDSTKLPYSYNNIGEIYASQGKHQQALEYFEPSLRLSQELKLDDIEAHALMLNGNTHGYLGNYQVATRYLTEALALNVARKDVYGEALTHHSLAELHREKEQYPQALYYLERTEALQREINHRDALALTLVEIAEVYHLQGNTKLAFAKATEGLEVAQAVNQLEALGQAHDLLYTLRLAQGNTDQAIAHLVKAREITDALKEQRQSQALIKLQAGHELAQKQAEIELLKNEQALQQATIEKREVQARNRAILAILAFCLLAGCLALIGLLYRQRNIKTRHNRLLSEKNTVIMGKQEEIQAQNEQLQAAFEEIRSINESLEHKVRDRTRRLTQQNEQLAQFAFLNAHELRGPLASILGLVHLLQINHGREDGEIINRLEASSQQLDEVVRSINRTIEQDYHVEE